MLYFVANPTIIPPGRAGEVIRGGYQYCEESIIPDEKMSGI